MIPSSLQISIVTYRPDLRLLDRVLRKLELAIGAARANGALRSVHLALIDNSEDPKTGERVLDVGCGTKFTKVTAKTATLNASSKYALSFTRTAAGSCQVTVTFAGNAEYLASTVAKTFIC